MLGIFKYFYTKIYKLEVSYKFMTSRIAYNNPKKSGALGLPYHYEMISDKKRVLPFKKAIRRVCKNKRVLESGAGSGILSIMAAKSKAKKVYAVEIDPNIAKFAKENIKNIGLQKNIKFLVGDIKKITLKEMDNKKVDVVIAENLSTWQVAEPQIGIMNYINKFLMKNNGVRIPSLIFNYVELCQSRFKFGEVELKTYYFEFTGVKKSKLLSQKALFTKIDLSKINPITVSKTIKIRVNNNGILNSLRLTSPLNIYKDITFNSSDSLMPPVIVPLKKEIPVSKNNIVELNIKYTHSSLWENFKSDARLIKKV